MKTKTTFVFFLLLFLFISVGVKAFYVQVINRDKLIAYSHSQIVRETKTYPKRGHILDRNGAPLAINVQKYNIFTFGKDLNLFSKELKKLSKVIPSINYSSTFKEVKGRKKFTWIERKIDLDDNALSELKKLKTIVVESQSSRFYPNHELLAQTLGFVGIDNEGLSGIEYFFNEDLKGEALIHKYFKDAKGRPVKYKSAIVDHQAKDVTLSIDKDIQADLEEYLKEGVEKAQAKIGGAAVMDADTGEIWAMANYPSFDPNSIKKKDKNHLKLSFVTDPFEPGSIFKTLTVLSAMENNIVRGDTNYYCERGKLRVGKHLITESDSSHNFEWLSVEEILKYSSNIGTTKIAFDLTYPTLSKTLKSFGIGEKTGIEIPGESRGILDDTENVSPIRLSNISFGQGVATTGVQMLKAYAMIANGGYEVEPTIIKTKKKKDPKRLFNKKTVNTITDMLIKAVSEGTGSKAQIEHFEIAGKTSTAQRPDERGGYSGYVSGFIGFPVNVEKRFVVFVYVDNPVGDYYGNLVAAPIFKKITKNILYKRKEYKTIANSKDVKKDYVNIKVSSKRHIRKGEVPNMIGLDKRSAKKILESLNVKYELKGFGIVHKQNIPEGTKISESTLVKLKFAPPKYE